MELVVVNMIPKILEVDLNCYLSVYKDEDNVKENIRDKGKEEFHF